ncbi:hypothetical protein ACS0TY_018157 [Phlomoides rotata]
MSEVEGGKPFSQVVNAAKSLGFTEPSNESVTPGNECGRPEQKELWNCRYGVCLYWDQ